MFWSGLAIGGVNNGFSLRKVHICTINYIIDPNKASVVEFAYLDGIVFRAQGAQRAQQGPPGSNGA